MGLVWDPVPAGSGGAASAGRAGHSAALQGGVTSTHRDPPQPKHQIFAGLLGAGNMGSAMACNLLRKGYRLMVCDMDDAAAERLVQLGATRAATPAHLAATPGQCCRRCWAHTLPGHWQRLAPPSL